MPQPDTANSNCSDAEWQARVDLAALYRLAVHYGWTDVTSTHMSARIPDDPDCYLLNTHDYMFDEITASNLVRMRYDGNHQVDSHVVNEAGHIIHSGILGARPDVNFVIHSHTRAGIAVSAMPGGLRPLSQHSGFVLGTLSSHRYQDSTSVADEGAELARDLGRNFTMLLQNHGLLAVGRTAAEVFMYHYYLEMSCKVQVDVMSCTDNPIEISDEALAPLLDWGNPDNGVQGDHQWPALMRLLDRTHADFRS